MTSHERPMSELRRGQINSDQAYKVIFALLPREWSLMHRSDDRRRVILNTLTRAVLPFLEDMIEDPDPANRPVPALSIPGKKPNETPTMALARLTPALFNEYRPVGPLTQDQHTFLEQTKRG